MSFRSVQSPACPVPLNCGDTLTDTNFSALVESVHSIHESGRVLATACANRSNINTIPICGHYGSTFSESNLQADIPVEIFPGYTHYAVIIGFKLYFNASPARYHTIQATLINGTASQVLLTYTSNPLGNGYVASTNEETRADYGQITPAIVPSGNSQLGILRLSNTFTAARGNVNGSPLYFQGITSVTLKQYLPCP